MKKYVNAKKVLPAHLIKEIQKYVQGTYLYIPKSERTAWGLGTGIREELNQRNEQIINSYSEGMDLEILAELYSLSEERLRAIIFGYVYPFKKKDEVITMQNDPQFDKVQAKKLFEEAVQKHDLPVQYVDVGFSNSFVNNDPDVLTFYYTNADQQRIDFKPMLKELAGFYKRIIQLKQVGAQKTI